MRVLHFISVLSVLVGVAGAVLLTYGVWLIYPPAGFMISRAVMPPLVLACVQHVRAQPDNAG